MRKYLSSVLTLIATVLITSSCTEEMEYKDAQVSAPAQLFDPVDGKSVTLQSSSTASVYFEWAGAQAEDGIAPNYEVVFDELDGDFSEPIYRVTADVNGSVNHATVLHKTLNSIAAKAGAGSGETVTVQWTVFAYRGLNSAKASDTYTLTLTRFYGFDEIPASLYVVGDGVENGSIICSSSASGEFEVFCELEAGKGISLNTSADGSGTGYYLDGTIIKESGNDYTVTESGVYRIQFDFNVASVAMMERIESLKVFFCPDNATIMDLNYEGGGVFRGQGLINWKQESWGRDERYKLEMTYANGSVIHWGPTNAGLDGRPNGAPEGDSYYDMMEWPVSQWDNKWKFDTIFDGAPEGANPGAIAEVIAYFNGSQYRHYVQLAN